MTRSISFLKLLLIGMVVMASLSGSARASSVQVPSWLAGKWEEKSTFPGYQPDRIAFTADGRYLQEITREVGQYGTYIPYPTPCRHLEEGEIESLGPASGSTIERYARSRRQAPELTLLVRIRRVELIPSVENGAYCPDWLVDAQGRVSRGESSYEWHFSAPGRSALFDPWREIEFARASGDLL